MVTGTDFKELAGSQQDTDLFHPLKWFVNQWVV